MPRTKGTEYVTEIYQRLVGGLEEGGAEVYDQVLSEYGKRKGSFYRALSMLLSDAKGKIKGIKKEEEEYKERVEKLKEEVEELENRKENLNELKRKKIRLNNELEKLNSELENKKKLLEEIQRLEEFGFSPEMLSRLYLALKEAEAKRGLSGKEALGKFFEDLKDYDGKRGFELEARRLGEVVKEERERKDEIKRELERLEKRYKSREEVVNTLEELKRTYGVKEEQIISWSRIVWSAGGDVEGLEGEIQEYGKIGEAIKAKKEGLKRLDEEEGKKRAALDELLSKRKKTEEAINEIKKLSIKEMSELKEKAKSEIEETIREAVKYGEEMGRMEKVLGEREEISILFGILANPSSVSKELALKANLIMFHSFEEWLQERGKELRNGDKVLSGVKELKELLYEEGMPKWIPRSLRKG